MAIAALKCGVVPPAKQISHPSLNVSCFGIHFENPVGLAAGFDKNAEAVSGLLAQGFGFVEAGTVTPLPQPGNPKPRIFRLAEDEAIINRMGFNNKGVHTYADNLSKPRPAGVVGANIGKNKDSLDAVYDYVACLNTVYPLVDYVVVNVSSPNTVGLRDLQRKNALEELMTAINDTRNGLAAMHSRKVPVLYKIAPDLAPQDKEDIVAAALTHQVDGLIVTNTTITRPDTLRSVHANEKGGLSGKPLKSLAAATLKDIYKLSYGKIPLIGVGGIASAEDAYERIRAGASLVQVYSALIYQGFALVQRINEGLVKLLERDGFARIQDAVGKDA